MPGRHARGAGRTQPAQQRVVVWWVRPPNAMLCLGPSRRVPTRNLSSARTGLWGLWLASEQNTVHTAIKRGRPDCVLIDESREATMVCVGSAGKDRAHTCRSVRPRPPSGSTKRCGGVESVAARDRAAEQGIGEHPRQIERPQQFRHRHESSRHHTILSSASRTIGTDRTITASPSRHRRNRRRS